MVKDGELDLAPETDKLVSPPSKVDGNLSDEEAFESAMEEVRPLGWSATPLNLPQAFEIPVWSDSESEALEELETFVAGRGEIDPFATGEGVEGASSLRNERYLPRLKNGDFSVQDHLDLHGLDAGAAREELAVFLRRAQHKGYACVRIIHGRGTHSPSEPSIVKRAVTQSLSSRKMRRTVIAFASARWRDGGSGAVYVLLYRKWRPAQR